MSDDAGRDNTQLDDKEKASSCYVPKILKMLYPIFYQ